MSSVACFAGGHRPIQSTLERLDTHFRKLRRSIVGPPPGTGWTLEWNEIFHQWNVRMNIFLDRANIKTRSHICCLSYWRLSQHIANVPQERWIRRILRWCPAGRYRTGRPHFHWESNMFFFPERRFVAGFFRRLLAYLTPDIAHTYPSHHTYPTHIHSKRIPPIRIPPIRIRSTRIPPVRIHSLRIHSKGLHQQVLHTYPFKTYPTSTYPFYAYPFNAYPFKRCASAGMANVSHQYISHQYVSVQHVSHQYGSIQCVSMQKVCIKYPPPIPFQRGYPCLYIKWGSILMYETKGGGMSPKIGLNVCNQGGGMSLSFEDVA